MRPASSSCKTILVQLLVALSNIALLMTPAPTVLQTVIRVPRPGVQHARPDLSLLQTTSASRFAPLHSIAPKTSLV